MQNSRVDTLLDEADTLFERPGEDIEDRRTVGSRVLVIAACLPTAVSTDVHAVILVDW